MAQGNGENSRTFYYKETPVIMEKNTYIYI